ncbi:MAG: TonB-dependent receptor plug domain-containing protein [Paludibacter sp.]|nr:TonB-dependent receptor plug domain-containing protein [Paludibacter sp.]
MSIVSNQKFFIKFTTISLCLVFLCEIVTAQQKVDTTKIYSISEITVTENFRNTEVRSTAPLQILSSKKIEQLNVLQVSDAVKHFSGVTVKDYGGIGGLKTVSVRSLGANHTAVSYDGITLTDCQTGQIDLGRFSLENVDMISLNNGQSDNIFQPARLFASSSVLNIRTISPSFVGNKKINGKIGMKAGSFGLLNPSLWLESEINPKISATFSGEWLSANGKYPYTLKYGPHETDSISTETRQNTDVKNLRIEGALYGNFSEKESGYIKSYFYQSERGLPGATVFYNAESSSKQRVWDNTFFTQGHFQKEFSKKWVFQTNAKYNSGYLHYLDPTYLNSDEKLENSYLQQEIYGSASVLFRAFEHLSFSASTDAAFTSLNSDLNHFSFPERFSFLSDIAAKYVTNNFLITSSLLGTMLTEKLKIGSTDQQYNKLSPFISISVKPIERTDFRVRMFYKNIFQVPTFNDLYYPSFGNRNLKPENANQFNIGLTYTVSIGKWLPLFSLTLDGYHNEVLDKIVSFPNKNTFGWTTLNLGKVNIDGIDFTAETALKPSDKIAIIIGTSYTYQRALNVTNSSDLEFKNQIPYTPRISGSGKIGIETPVISVSYSLLWSGKRYTLFQNYAENRLPGFGDHSISVSRIFKLKSGIISTNFEILNLMNKNYSIIRFFPMPGRSIRASVSYKF